MKIKRKRVLKNIPKEKYKNVKKVAPKILNIIAYIITIISIFQWTYDNVNSPDKIMEFQSKAIKYYNDGNYEKSIQFSRKAYNANKNVPDVIYYYCSALLKSLNNENLELANEILFENEYILDIDELVLFSYTEMLLGDYKNAYKIINKIENPQNIDAKNIRKYILASTKSAFEISYEEGVERANLNYIILEKKYSSFGSKDSKTATLIFPESDISRIIEEEFSNEWETDKYYVKYSSLLLSNIFYDYALMNNDIGKLSMILKLGAENFGFFKNYDPNILTEYIGKLNHYMSSYDYYHEENMNAIKIAMNKIVAEYEYQQQCNPEYYLDIIERIKLVNNFFIEKHDLDWRKFNVSLSNKSEGTMEFEEITSYSEVTSSSNIKILYSASSDGKFTINYIIEPGQIAFDEEVFVHIILNDKLYILVPRLI